MGPELAQRFVNGLREAGVNFITYLPETRMSEILARIREDSAFDLILVASEAEGVVIASGAALGGKQAAVYMEGTGIFVSAYNLLSVGVRLGVPVLLLASYVGSLADQRNTFRFAPTGVRTEAQLEALGIKYQVIEEGGDIEARIRDAVRMMNSLKEPVALLFTGEFTL